MSHTEKHTEISASHVSELWAREREFTHVHMQKEGSTCTEESPEHFHALPEERTKRPESFFFTLLFLPYLSSSFKQLLLLLLSLLFIQGLITKPKLTLVLKVLR